MDCLLLEYSYTDFFCKLLLFPATVLNLLTVRYFVILLEVLYKRSYQLQIDIVLRFLCDLDVFSFFFMLNYHD